MPAVVAVLLPTFQESCPGAVQPSATTNHISLIPRALGFYKTFRPSHTGCVSSTQRDAWLSFPCCCCSTLCVRTPQLTTVVSKTLRDVTRCITRPVWAGRLAGPALSNCLCLDRPSTKLARSSSLQCLSLPVPLQTYIVVPENQISSIDLL